MNLLKKIILFILIFHVQNLSQIRPGAEQIALSHSDVAQTRTFYALFNNPAGSAEIVYRATGVYYSPSPFGLSKLANGSILYLEPFSFGNLSVAFSNYGFELYRTNTFSVSFSKKIFKRFFVGATVNYKNLSIKNYGNDGTLIFNLGIIATLSKQVNMGFAVYNISRSSFGDEGNQLPSVFNLGFFYKIISSLNLNFAVQKEIEMNASLRLGIDYKIIKYLNLRIGAMTEPSSFSAGVGINYSIFQIDYAVFNNQDLGFTHQFGITLKFESI